MTSVRFTERLRLEPIGPHHADDLYAIHDDDAVAEWYGRWTRKEARERAAAFAHGWLRDGVAKWIAYHRETGELVGRGGMSRAVVDGEEVLEVGWSVLGRLWGRGYATEIGRESFVFAFDELGDDRVIAFTEQANTRSVAVMKRLGMRYVKTFLSHGLVAGLPGLHDDAPFVVYEMLRADYELSASP